MMRKRALLVALVTALALVSIQAASAAGTSFRPRIDATEVGYFGSATVTHDVSVFVYSNEGPRAGNRVTVCLGGTCKRAVGHNAALNWYSASFRVRRGLWMWDRVHFSAVASSAGGSTRVAVTDRLLCIHNNGSTPQG